MRRKHRHAIGMGWALGKICLRRGDRRSDDADVDDVLVKGCDGEGLRSLDGRVILPTIQTQTMALEQNDKRLTQWFVVSHLCPKRETINGRHA
jgi:hypothetical protein